MVLQLQQQISFDNGTRNRNGVAVPVDDYGNLPSCRYKARKPGFQSQKCFRCEQVIHFDKNYRSLSGKYIPLDWNSGKRHECNETGDLKNRQYRLFQEFYEKNVSISYLNQHEIPNGKKKELFMDFMSDNNGILSQVIRRQEPDFINNGLQII